MNETLSFAFRVDTQAPTITLNSPNVSALKDGVNGTITISGSVTDGLSSSTGVDGSINTIKLYYSIADQVAANETAPTSESAWKQFDENDNKTCTTSSETFSVERTFSTQTKNLAVSDTKLILTTQETAAIQYVWIKIVAQDVAGHSSVVTRKVKVDRDTDRPSIRFISPNKLKDEEDNLMTNSTPIWLKNTGTVIAIISDDDSDGSSIVKKLEYKKNTETDWTEIPLGSSNSFQFDVDDGDNKVYFRITDNKDTVFTSAATQSLQEMKFTDGVNEITSSAVLNMKVDKSSPKINTTNIKYDVFDSTANGGVGSYVGTFEKDSAKYSYGGTNNKVRIQIPASDQNGIKSVKATLKNSSGAILSTYNGVCDEATYNDEGEHIWTISDISFEGIEIQATIEIEVMDNAGLTSQEKIILPVDNTGPKITFSAPKLNGEVGVISSNEVTAYGTLSEICSEVKFAITTDPSDTAPKLDGSTRATVWNGYNFTQGSDLVPLTTAEKNAIKVINYPVVYQDVKGTSLSWYVYFNGEEEVDAQTNSPKLENWLDEDHIGITTKEALGSQENPFDKIVDLYLWIYAKDEAGNTTYQKHPLRVDPQGGRPSVTIDYPESGAALGGTIRLSGSVEDNKEVKSVWVQIISGAHGEYTGTFGTGSHHAETGVVTSFNLKATDMTYLSDCGYDVRKITNKEAESTTWATSAKSDDIAGTYGIKANLSGFTWNLKINIDQEFKPTSSINNMYIRVYALDDEGKWSYTENKYFQIDASKPEITDVMLKQYADGTSVSSILNNTATPIAQKTFVAGDYLNSKNGNWYATLKAKDDSRIGDVYYVDTEGNETKLTVNEHYTRSTTSNTDDTVYVAYPLTPTGNVCSWNFSIKVEDTNIPANEGKQDFELNYDNLNPKLSRPNSNANYSIPATVKQSEGFYTIKSQIDESSASGTQSGLKAVAFYFLRRNAVNNQVYVMDPMQVRTGNVQVKSAKTLTLANAGDNVVYDSGLYWLKRTISRDENSQNTFTYTSANTTDENSIHIGGLVQISGTLYTIIGKTGNKIIVDKGIPSQTTAYFALGMVVDTKSEKGFGPINADGYYDTWTAGDDDRMNEAIGGTTANPTWEAQISCKNILDGSVELHYVVFDKAGNYSIGIVGNKDWSTYSGASGLYSTADVNEVKEKTPGVSGDYVDFVYSFDAEEPCYVKNNAPRLSMITVGCDYDGNGVIENNENETKSYYNSQIEGKNKAGGVTDNLIVDSGTEAFMTLKDKSSIIMEIIGGNGNLYYSYNIDGVSRTITGANTNTIGIGNYDSETSDYLVKEGGVDVVNVNAATHQKTIDISLDDFKNYLGKGSGTGSANTAFIENNTDDKPYTTFTYTIWDSTDGEIVAGANALNTWSTQNAQMSVKLDVQVHDQTPPKMFMNGFTKNHFDPATGHIDLRTNLPNTPFKDDTGIFDKDPKVSGKIKVTGYAYDDIRLESLWLKVDDFTFTGLADSPSTADSSRMGFVKVATYNSASGEWTGFENTTQGWKFTVDATHEDAYQNDKGHKVIWELELDTTKVTCIAGTDKTISLYVKDVRGVNETLTNGLYSSNDEVNGTGDTDRNAPNYRVDIVPYITKLSRSNTNVETKRSKLGKYQVVIGEGLSLEGFNLPTTAANLNNGYFRATTANKNAPRETVATNGTRITATSLTNTGATLTTTARSGYVVAVTNDIISLNNMNTGNECAPENMYNDDDEWTDDVYLNCWKNDEYFYKSNDPISPAMDRIPSKKVNNAYNVNVSTLYGGWATQSSKFFASYPNTTGSGNTGNAPSPASETNATNKDMPNNHHFGDPATFYDVVIDENGNRYNFLLDCWQGSTTGWGRNFVINRNGYYTHDNGFGSGAPNSNTLRHVIERMGRGGTSPDNADSSDGTDELFNQFLNPRMALNNGDAYITYYDRYAKCLKWAMVAPKDSQTEITRKYATEGVWKQSSGREGNNVGNYYQEINEGSERRPDWKIVDDFGNGENTFSNYYKNGGFIVAGYDTLQNNGSKTNLDVGRWSSIAIDTSNSAPIVAYYDATHKQLWLATSNGSGSGVTGANTAAARLSYPINNNSPVLTGDATSATQGNAWTRIKVGGDENDKLRLGQYVSMVVDSSNNLHIACYGTGGGNKLYYIKGTKTSYGNYTFTTTCVDPNGAGTWTDIKLEGNNPVISYYDPSNDSSESAIKVAYFDGTQWDHMAAPLSSSAISDRVTLALDITDGTSLATATANNSKLAVGYVSSRFDCVYLRKE